jgi:hypothetical protein
MHVISRLEKRELILLQQPVHLSERQFVPYYPASGGYIICGEEASAWDCMYRQHTGGEEGQGAAQE